MKNKYFSLFCLILISNISFGQFLSNLSTLNPAMTGLEDKHFGHVVYGHRNTPTINSITGLYNYSADKINSGVGIIVSQDQHPWSNFSRFGGSYQYTFNFSETTKLAVGTSLNYLSQNIRGSYQDVYGFNNKEYLKLNFGAAFNWKDLNVGVSYGNFDLIPHENPDPNETIGPNSNITNRMSAHAWYDFRIGDNFILSPSVVVTNNSNFNLFSLRGKHFNRFWWTVGYGTRDRANIGAGVRVLNKFYVGYNLGLSYSKLNNGVNSVDHRLSISYIFKK